MNNTDFTESKSEWYLVTFIYIFTLTQSILSLAALKSGSSKRKIVIRETSVVIRKTKETLSLKYTVSQLFKVDRTEHDGEGRREK